MIIQIDNIQSFIHKALQWALSFNVCCYLDSNNFTDPYSKFNTLIAVGCRVEVNTNTGDTFEQLAEFRKKHAGWMFGFLGYDLKTRLKTLLLPMQIIWEFLICISLCPYT